MSTQLEDTKRLGCAKPNDCASLLKSENLRMRIDENDKKNDALKLKSLSKAQAEENKVLRDQLEPGQAKQNIDRRKAEKEEEFNNIR